MASTVIRPRDQDPLDVDLISIPAADVDTDASADISITFPNLRTVYYAKLHVGAGYKANLLSTALNVATFRVYWDISSGVGAAGLVMTPAVSLTGTLGDSLAMAWGRK